MIVMSKTPFKIFLFLVFRPFILWAVFSFSCKLHNGACSNHYLYNYTEKLYTVGILFYFYLCLVEDFGNKKFYNVQWLTCYFFFVVMMFGAHLKKKEKALYIYTHTVIHVFVCCLHTLTYTIVFHGFERCWSQISSSFNFSLMLMMLFWK